MTSIYIIAVGEDYEDENGYFLIKRAPVGGGAWSRNASREYSSSSSTLGEKLVINDVNKNSTKLSLKSVPATVSFLRRYYKRSGGHYLGDDLDYDKVHWTIVGDDKRFIFVVAYKQNPRAHSRIILFGDFTDSANDTVKTVLLGYVSNQLGDVGFNKIHEYLDPVFWDEGLYLDPRVERPLSGIGWIYSSDTGEVDYLHGSKDCGQHRYTIPYPLT